MVSLFSVEDIAQTPFLPLYEMLDAITLSTSVTSVSGTLLPSLSVAYSKYVYVLPDVGIVNGDGSGVTVLSEHETRIREVARFWSPFTNHDTRDETVCCEARLVHSMR